MNLTATDSPSITANGGGVGVAVGGGVAGVGVSAGVGYANNSVADAVKAYIFGSNVAAAGSVAVLTGDKSCSLSGVPAAASNTSLTSRSSRTTRLRACAAASPSA